LGKLPDPARLAVQAYGSLRKAFEQVASEQDDLPGAGDPDQSVPDELGQGPAHGAAGQTETVRDLVTIQEHSDRIDRLAAMFGAMPQHQQERCKFFRRRPAAERQHFGLRSA
jgi:hypothetical protein